MRRELTEQEKIEIVRAIENEEKQLKELKEGIWYIDETLLNQQMIWDYEDKIRSYKRRIDKERFTDAKKKMMPEIEWAENSIKVFKDQLEFGVEVKEKKGGEKENE